jgi:hypothetical protein
MVHGSTVDAASERVLPGRARPGLTTGRPVLAGSMTMLSRLLWWLCRPVRDGSTAAAPPSASLPSGIAGRRIRSLIHASLLFGPQVAGSHIYEPLFRAERTGHSLAWLRLDTSLKSIQLRPSGARKLGARNACTGSEAIWRTLLSYPALRLERKYKSWLLLRMHPVGKGVLLILGRCPISGSPARDVDTRCRTSPSESAYEAR